MGAYEDAMRLARERAAAGVRVRQPTPPREYHRITRMALGERDAPRGWWGSPRTWHEPEVGQPTPPEEPPPDGAIRPDRERRRWTTPSQRPVTRGVQRSSRKAIGSRMR